MRSLVPIAIAALAAGCGRDPGPKNMAQVAPGVYRGAQPTEKGFERLKQLGIRTVINLRSHHSERERVEALGMAAVEIPIKAGVGGSEPPTDEQIAEFFRIVQDPTRQPVYFHCAHGEDRTGTMAALYRIELDGWTPEQAIEEMQAFGYNDVFRDLIRFVREYKPRGLRRPD